MCEMYDVPKLAENFCMYLLDKGKSQQTIRTYSHDLKIFYEFINEYKQWKYSNIKNITNEHIFSVTAEDIETFKSYCNKEGHAENSRARRIATLKSFYYYLKKKKKISYNIMQEIDGVKIPKRKLKFLTLDECKCLLSKIDGIHEIRDRAIVTLFLNTGLRLSELVAINLDDIKENKLCIIRKGNKEEELPLNQLTLKALKEYLSVRPFDAEDNALFVCTHDKRIKRMSERAVQQMVKKYLDLINRSDLSVHKLRTSFATIALNDFKMPLAVVQQLLSHEDPATTNRYADVYGETKQEAIDQIKIG